MRVAELVFKLVRMIDDRAGAYDALDLQEVMVDVPLLDGSRGIYRIQHVEQLGDWVVLKP